MSNDTNTMTDAEWLKLLGEVIEISKPKKG